MQLGKRYRAQWLVLAIALSLPSLPALSASGPAPSVKTSASAASATTHEKRFIIILQSSSDPSEQLKASIPAEFQDFEVFNARRTSEGKTLYDICLGHFATLADAERAQRTLLRRFPNASVIPVKPAPAANVPVKGQ